ncbi:cytochrome P450 [Crucibulum laeve]|uniref:Cytochrome P450 n=1 Tax=Crucibulum laeve TaxID=68775 RepID=A0A5C3MKB0_9AGAR|nr:cytochrome P450 [Crucibulum laeve]
MASLWLVPWSLTLVYLIRKLLSYWNAVQSIQNLPGYRTILSQSTVFANFLPGASGITPGRNHIFINKHNAFQYFGWDIISAIAVFPNSKPDLLLADAAAIKEVTSSRPRFPKPVERYTVLSFFGRNIVASEFEEWKKYRKISAPAFSDRNNKLVWDEAVRIMDDLFHTVWAGKETVTIEHCIDITVPIALFVIGAAGFGQKLSWQDDTVVPPNHAMTFKDALHIVTADIFIKLVTPSWALGLTKRLRTVRDAFEELQQYMSEMIKERQYSESKERHDLFSSLLEANNQDLDEAKLTESELIGNIFIFLVAGHETTAHAMCYAFALLALYQDEQEALYQQIKSLIPDGRLPTYEEMPLLTRSMAVLNETLRMFPPVTAIPKYSAEDTVLTAGNINEDSTTIPVPQGTAITISTPGLHYNPRYWEDPHTFKPSRFLKQDWPRDAFLPFSGGARACLGRKFLETEGVAILTLLVSQYKIEVKEEAQFAAETFEARKTRILDAKAGLTLTPVHVPLTFTRRA